MDFETMFASTLTETVLLREPTGTDTYGGPTYVGATTLTVPAWISRKPREVRTRTGETRVASAVVHIGHPSGGGAVPLPSPECELTMPNGDKPQILYVESIVDPSGDRHTAIYL
jgi:hypothetical protein